MQQRQPANTTSDSAATPALTLLTPRKTSYRWYQKVAAVMAAIFCFELGVFLLIYPWISNWDANGAIVPAWGRAVWTSSWFRGAVSGIGILDIYISFAEVLRLRRFSA